MESIQSKIDKVNKQIREVGLNPPTNFVELMEYYRKEDAKIINSIIRSAVVPQESIPTKSDGHKESNGKQEFELDWEFIESMAKRMAKNKTKYGKDNWKRPMDVEQLKQALFRHSISIMKGNYNDEDKLDHLDAIALNAMFIKYQLTHHGLHSK